MSMRSAGLRIGLLSAAGIFFFVGLVIWNIERTPPAPVTLGLSAIAWIAGVITAALALLPSVPKWAAWLVLISFIGLTFQSAYFTSLYYSPLAATHTDDEMSGKYALEALKRGQNPYEWNFSDITRVYRDTGLSLTPTLDGTYQNHFTYPALSLFVLWAFDRVGLGQVRTVNFVFLL